MRFHAAPCLLGFLNFGGEKSLSAGMPTIRASSASIYADRHLPKMTWLTACTLRPSRRAIAVWDVSASRRAKRMMFFALIFFWIPVLEMSIVFMEWIIVREWEICQL